MGAETDVYWNLLRRFLKFLRETGCERYVAHENTIVLYCRLHTHWGMCPIRVVPRNESEGIILLRELVRISDVSQLNT